MSKRLEIQAFKQLSDSILNNIFVQFDIYNHNLDEKNTFIAYNKIMFLLEILEVLYKKIKESLEELL